MDDKLLSFALASMKFLSPEPSRQADHEVMARALVTAVESQDPLFKDDADKKRTVSVVIAVAFREGSLRVRVNGDCTESKPGEPCKGRPRSFCTMQVHESIGGTAALNDDPVLCFNTGLTHLRTSVRICPKFPIAQYAYGREGACQDLRSQRISNDRMHIAKQLYTRKFEETASR